VDMVDRWRAHAASGRPIDVTPELLRVTLRILGFSMFGLDLSDDADSIGKALLEVLHHTTERARNVFQIPDAIPTPANRRFKEALRALDRVVYGIIAERRRGNGGGSGEPHADLLQM